MARFPLRGSNQIRARLLTGTSGLNGTLSKFRSRDRQCPACDSGETESVEHFLLRCPHFEDLRETFRNAVGERCTCDQDDPPADHSCQERFDGMTDQEKVLFILGMPVWYDNESRETEDSVDAASRGLVMDAYQRRSEILEKTIGGIVRREPSPPSSPSRRDISRYFIPLPAAAGGQVRTTNAIAAFARPATGSGSNGRSATECS